MPFAPKIVLHSPTGYHVELDALVEQFLAGGVKWVLVVGEGCEQIESIIDEIVVGDGSDPERFLLTSSHPGESLSEVVGFANLLSGQYEGEVEVVEI